MPNANNFQASRPNIVYAQVNQAPDRRRNNFDLAGNLASVAGAWDTVQKSLGLDPASVYNKTMAETQKVAQYEKLREMISGADPDKRDSAREAAIKAFPQFKDALMAEDLMNLKSGDRELLDERLNYEDIMNGGPMRGPASETAPAENLTSDMYLDQGAGSPYIPPQGAAATQAAPGQPAQTPPVDSDLAGADWRDQPLAAETPADTGMAPPIDAALPGEDPRSGEAAAMRVAEAAAVSGLPAEHFHVSPQTGEPKIKPELVSQYPNLPISAFLDVPAAGPEDEAIRRTAADYGPGIFQSRRDVLQSGAALRIARSRRLNIQPDLNDIMIMKLDQAGLDMLGAELRAAVGAGIDPDTLDIEVPNNLAVWMDPRTSPEKRSSPEIAASVKAYMAANPELQKVYYALAEGAVKNNIEYMTHQENLDWKKATLVERGMYHQGVLDARKVENATQKEKNANDYAMAQLNYQKDLALNKARIANYAAETDYTKLKAQWEKSGHNSKVMEMALKFQDMQSAKNIAIERGARELMRDIRAEDSRLRADRVALLGQLPSGMEIFSNSLLTRPTDPEKAKVYDEMMKNGQYASIVADLKRNGEQLFGVDGNGGVSQDLKDARAKHQEALDQMRKTWSRTPEESRREMLRGMLVTDPQGADWAVKRELEATSPNPKATSALFDALDYNFPDGLSTMRKVYVKREPSVGGKPGKVILDATGNPVYEEPTADQLIKSLIAQAGKGHLNGIVNFNLGNVNPEQLRKAVNDWLKWEHDKYDAMRGTN